MKKWLICKNDKVIYTSELIQQLYNTESSKFLADVIKSSLFDDFCVISFEIYSRNFYGFTTFEKTVHKRHLHKLTVKNDPEYFL